MHESSLTAVTITDLLEVDPRPTFVVGLGRFTELSSSSPQVPQAVTYRNPALSANPALASLVEGPQDHHVEFWRWVSGDGPKESETPSSMTPLSYLGVFWTRTILQNRWIVLGGNTQAPHRKASTSRQGSTDFIYGGDGSGGSRVLAARPAIKPSPADRRQSQILEQAWVVPPLTPDQEPFLDVIYRVDWKSTPLGPIESWSPLLHQSFRQILVDSRPLALYWGSQHTAVYNEAFSSLCGRRHPSVLGQPVEKVWPKEGERLKLHMQSSAQNNRASIDDEWAFFIEKPDGSLQETYLKWSIIPVTDHGQCLGFLHSVVDTTSMRLWERRMKMLIDLGEVLVTARDVSSYWRKTLEDLGQVEPRYDIPLAILYSVHDGSDEEMQGADAKFDSTKVCRYEGSLGVPNGHAITPPTLNLRTSEEALSPAFREAIQTQYPVIIRTNDWSFPSPLLEGLEWRGFSDPCQAAVVCPIRPTKEEDVMGLLVLGLNPRRPYDNGYRQYISLLNQKLTTSLASTVLLEEEARRGRNAAEQAAYDQAMLKEKLDASTKEATEFVERFEAVAQFIPVGMCFSDTRGSITFANDAWYRITGVKKPSSPGGSIALEEFLSCVFDEDQINILRGYEEVRNGRSASFEFRVKLVAQEPAGLAPTSGPPSFEKPGLDLVGIDDTVTDCHVLAVAKAELAPDNTIRHILTCLTDVTSHKRSAELAVRRAQQAENLKRMAESATVGMYDMNLEGRLLGANNVFFKMCGMEKVDPVDVVVKPFQSCIVEEDQGILGNALAKLVKDCETQTAELRFKNPWTVEDRGVKVVAPRWVLATFMPVKSSEGIIRSFTGCLSDVSLQKWQLERERQHKEAAIESKRLLESFIDMTSHEMRNPLSAVIHCADAIVSELTLELVERDELDPRAVPPSIAATAGQLRPRPGASASTPTAALPAPTSTQARTTGGGSGTAGAVSGEVSPPNVRVRIENSIKNAEIVIMSSQHQKRIVDDILDMSKLDAKLLVVTPTTANPVRISRDAIKMFEAQARQDDINLSMVVNDSYKELGVEFLNFDPSRVRQVLINLLTNALKFTFGLPVRNVTVSISASKSRPTDASSSVQFVPRALQESPEPEDAVQLVEGRGEPIFLTFEVTDTGRGLDKDDKKILFQRFSQASPRTHIKHGGSGLGLFISRRLTEMQNGAIGVASQPGVGSTFAFYIETFRPNASELQVAAAAMGSLSLGLGSSYADISAKSKMLRAAGGPSARSQMVVGEDRRDAMGILLVEDNVIIQPVTKRSLENLGYMVGVASNGLEALEFLKTTDRYKTVAGGKEEEPFPLSCILMDMQMPGMDGLTCTRRIRELEGAGETRGGRIPIIAVSANARVEQSQEAIAAGCDDVLVKPYRIPELIEKMNTLLKAGGQLGRGAAGGGGGAAVMAGFSSEPLTPPPNT